MKTSLKRLAIGTLAAFVLCTPLAARADEDGDHDLARDLYEDGEIHALAEILRIVNQQAPGDIVAVDLIKRGDRWIYQFQVVASDGRRTIVDVDAGLGTIAAGAKD
jgi:uncharacterized membrane protein YkoI